MTERHNNTGDFVAYDPGDEGTSPAPSPECQVFADALPDIVWIADAEGRSVYYSRHWYDYTGIEPGPGILARAWEAVHPDERDVMGEHWRLTLESKATEFEHEFRLRRADGAYGWFYLRGSARPDRRAGGIERWLGTCANIDAVKSARASSSGFEQRYRLAMDAANLGLWESDLVLGTEEWSEEIATMFGRPEKAGMNAQSVWREILHPDDREAGMRRFREGIESPNPSFENRYRVMLPDGKSVRHIAAHGTLIRDGAGNAVRVIGVCRDMTEESETLASLQHSEERYRALVDASSQVTWTNSADGEMRGPQPGWAALTGQTEAEYAGFGWAEAVHPDDAQPTIDGWNESLRTRSVFLFEHRVRRHDGCWRLFAIRAVPVLDAKQNIREWVGMHTDISEKREAEQTQARTLAQLMAVLESATDGIIVANTAGEVLMMNPVALALHDFKSGDEARKHFREYADTFTLRTPGGSVIPPDDWPMARVLRGETFTEYECLVRHGDEGTEWWASYGGSPARDEHGNISLVVLIARDVSERKRMEVQRDALMRRIEESAERQRKFLREMLSSMSEGRLRLCDSANELPYTATPTPAYEPVTLDRKTIRTLRQQTIAACQAAGMSPERESDLVTAVGEASMNAVVHAGGGLGTIYVNKETGIVQIWVRDYGKGINEESLHRATLEKGFTTAGTLGHGFWMMLKTADRVHLLTGAGGTTVVIEQERRPAVPAWMQSFVEASQRQG